ncbi:glycosyl transferase [Dulcicalothrix desertica PCC 7102]|uniref:Glycosyl transferase n=1 Tax=Dulcicalothrix desertica PCC 7102 TaxID=232991 RepID=A0A3S1J567_9CYAN|nr:glycosyltransferase family 2 protein [Dulcicalothrix desertica]RUT07882.1 glycosyl transferase [Dulcicalothrix desertica PCC 7102]TWH39403.1 GT2 family glycosyltransferase [Dulcicalothrix desertica PCC 7102]
MKITVVIPTYRRPQDLKRCLEALQNQNRRPEQVLVVVRDTDAETWTFLESFALGNLPLRILTVRVTGVIAAMNLGLDAAFGDIIAFTDDDAAPHTDWLERIEATFLSDSRIGAVGGRDFMYYGSVLQDYNTHPGASDIVGRLQWFGRVIGNHHIGSGEAREADVLKGVNVSYRANAINKLRFDERLLGTGAQVHFELAFCLTLKRAGWKLIYDPSIAVDHFPAQRFDEDKRNTFNKIATINLAHNETLILLEHLSPIRKLIYLLWAVLIGTRDAYGILQIARFFKSEKSIAIEKFIASMKGRYQGWQTWLESDFSNQTQPKTLSVGDLE